MRTVRIYCFRALYYYGFGITPEAAVDAAVKAGFTRSKQKEGIVQRLPEGTTAYEVDEMGTLRWNHPDKGTKLVTYKYNPKVEGKWEPKEDE